MSSRIMRFHYCNFCVDFYLTDLFAKYILYFGICRISNSFPINKEQDHFIHFISTILPLFISMNAWNIIISWWKKTMPTRFIQFTSIIFENIVLCLLEWIQHFRYYCTIRNFLYGNSISDKAIARHYCEGAWIFR